MHLTLGVVGAVLVPTLAASREYAYMRPFEHPLVILGPSLQVFRGAFLALAFLPFRKVIIEIEDVTTSWLSFQGEELDSVGSSKTRGGIVRALVKGGGQCLFAPRGWMESRVNL